VFRYVCPAFLLAIFGMWLLKNVVGWDPISGRAAASPYVADLVERGNPVAWLSVILVVIVASGLAFTIASSKRYPDDLPA